MQLGFDLFSASGFEKLLNRLGLKADTSARALRRGLVMGGLAWVPMAIWSLASGNSQALETRLRFFYDFAAYAQFWIGIPLLSLAQVLIGRKMSHAISYLADSGIVGAESRDEYEKIVHQSESLACSGLVEWILVPLSYITPITWLIQEVGNGTPTWHALSMNRITFAGFWDGAFAVPLFWFLIYRWIWRVFIWFLALYRAAKLHLRLRASHPDKMAGLALISRAQATFGILLFVFGCVIASTVLYKMLIEHSTISAISVWSMIVAYVILGPLAFMAPMLVFTPRLIRLKRRIIYDHGRLGVAYAERFEQKWLDNDTQSREELLGFADIQSLADLNDSYDRAMSLKIIPFDMGNLAKLATAALGPMIPVIAKYLPVSETLKSILGFLGG